jgi:MEDS: MEthanogen/methylotroph, DcmR Sensory domain
LNNVVPFPSAGGAIARASGHLGSRLLSEPPPHAHAVQFYDDEPFLLETVGFFMSAGLAAGEAGLLIASSAHLQGILSQIDKDVRERASASGQLLLVDADAMLARFMHGDEPVESAFDTAVAHVIDGLFAGKWAAEAATRGLPKRVRAFGEMVDLLWKRGNAAAALRLEEYWNRATARYDLVLLCGYGMRNFYKADDTGPFGEVCRLHTHVMPTEHFAKGGADVFQRLRDISVLEQRARSLDSEVAYRAELEGALRATIDERVRAEGEPEAVPARVTTEAPGSVLRAALSRLSAPLHVMLPRRMSPGAMARALRAAQARLMRRWARRRAGR